MSQVVSMNPRQFVQLVTPLLEAQDLDGLLLLLKSRWTADQITSLLTSNDEDARKVAAFSLGLVGGGCCAGPLAEQLKSPDPTVNQMAEHALWSIWLRGGNPSANYFLTMGLESLGARNFDDAVAHFTRAIELDPNFAEAYNQRAIATYFQERYTASIADCRATVKRMPCHFGAWSGMGHCQAHLGLTEEAIKSYEKALEINPHLDCVREAAEELRQCLYGRKGKGEQER